MLFRSASLHAGQLSVDGRAMRRILSFDPTSGVLEAEGGVSLADIWRHTLPHGWWPAVVSGTMFPTMGGAVGMNLHGKNAYKVGPFGDHVLELDLLAADGTLRTLSRTQEPETFRAVIAGLGLLGAVTRVKLQLKRVHSGRMRVRPMVTLDLTHMFEVFREHVPKADYMVGWVDAFAHGDAIGRGLVHRADHFGPGEDPRGEATLALSEQDLPSSIMGLPKSLLWLPMMAFTNDVGMRVVNAIKHAQIGRAHV